LKQGREKKKEGRKGEGEGGKKKRREKEVGRCVKHIRFQSTVAVTGRTFSLPSSRSTIIQKSESRRQSSQASTWTVRNPTVWSK
jgi:hypothetical protein